MAEKIRNFFAKKKQDAKFKRLGPGHKLNDSASSSTSSVAKPKESSKRSEQTEASAQAAEAAVMRLCGQKKDTQFNTSAAGIKTKVIHQKLEAEKKASSVEATSHTSNIPDYSEASPHLTVQGVYFRCPLISEEILTKEDWRPKIKEFLFQQLEEERGLTACLIIHSCNYNRTKVTECVDILVRYLDNIIGNPSETKFHKIKCSNANFKDKVLPVLGATELLYAAGFRQQTLDLNNVEENFWVFNPENIEELEDLQSLRESLKSGNRVELELDRNVQVLNAGEAIQIVSFPPEFYVLTPEEIKQLQQEKSNTMEKQFQLRTKHMREKDEIRGIKMYKFALIRVRFPDALYLQGTFSVYEKFSEVINFVQSNLDCDLPFVLSVSSHKFEDSDSDQSLLQLKLVPASTLTFQWDPSIASSVPTENFNYLKRELMINLQSL